MSHHPNDTDRAKIEAYAALAMPEEIIAELLEIPLEELQKHYARDLLLAPHKANSKIAKRMFDDGLSGNTTAQIFWLKARAGWKEQDKLSVTVNGGLKHHHYVDAPPKETRIEWEARRAKEIAAESQKKLE